MDWLHLISTFFAGAFLTNAVPHFVSGMLGRPFQSPFAKPSGRGLSSATVNVLWGFFNIVVGYVLIRRGDFALDLTSDIVAFGLGMLAMSLFAARHFGALHGGDLKERS
jgi:hypothetical protein